MDTELQKRIERYWTRRAHDFGVDKRHELQTELKDRWAFEMRRHLPEGRHLTILDVGTGVGFFAFILQEMGHFVTGVDITQAMLDEARELAHLSSERLLEFVRMDAQDLRFPNACFDVVVSRNLTWTLPDPVQAYAEWHRVLRPGGVLLNFDANYVEQVLHPAPENPDLPAMFKTPCAHTNITPEMRLENRAITLAAGCADKVRPQWDKQILEGLGFADVMVDPAAGKRIWGAYDAPDAPLFSVWARKA